jgi:subtilisin family serine protease
MRTTAPHKNWFDGETFEPEFGSYEFGGSRSVRDRAPLMQSGLRRSRWGSSSPRAALGTSDLTGASPISAYDIGDVNGNLTNDFRFSYSGNVSRSADTLTASDFYRFTVDTTTQLTLTLSGMQSDVDLYLRDAITQTLLGQSVGYGTAAETITLTLTPGDYVVETRLFSDTNSSYTLDLRALSETVDPGNSLATAMNTGQISRTANKTYVNSITAFDRTDLYRFELRESSQINFSLNGFFADLDLSLLDIQGQLLIQGSPVSSVEEKINGVLLPGIYYLQVSSPVANAVSAYNLQIEGFQYYSPILPDYNLSSGYGRVNAAAAVAASLNLTALPPVPTLSNSWNLNQINAPAAWAAGYRGQGVTVAVIDSGVDIIHPDLIGNFWYNEDEIFDNGIDDDRNGYIDDQFGWNFGVGHNNRFIFPALDDDGHGTHVAGTIAAARDGVGMTGVAPEARIMALRLGNIDNRYLFDEASVSEAIYYAVNNGAQVINLSLTLPNTLGLYEAIAYATARNVVVVSAAGNQSEEAPSALGSYATRTGITVGATNSLGQLANFSNRAGSDRRMAYVTAPGEDIYATLPDGRYGTLSGTSMAAPHVAGVVALMLSANPTLTVSQVRQILTQTATYTA